MSYNSGLSSILLALSGEFGNYSEEDLMNSEEYKEHEFWIIDCPICGRKTLDSFYICSGCGWEYDLFIDYDNDASFSACNRTTLGEYKNDYRILKDAFDKRKNGEQETFYIITFTSKDYPASIPVPRTYGAFENFDACRKALNENSLNMHMPLYDSAVVESIDMKSNIEKTVWFIWNKEKQGFFETDQKADCTTSWWNLVLWGDEEQRKKGKDS